MIVAIMQPYFLPYIGYFQLMAAVDTFVFHDDVQYTKGGWTNRNRYLHHHAPAWMSLPVEHASHLGSIRERHYTADKRARAALGNKVREAYRQAPRFDAAMPVLDACLASQVTSVGDANAASLEGVANMLGLRVRMLKASSLHGHQDLAAQDRVIAICKALGASTYVNAAGGTALYDEATFADAGIELRFLRHALPPYDQFGGTFCAGLSVLDVLMFNDLDAVAAQLHMARTVSPDEARAA
jgi:hypothetical protein